MNITGTGMRKIFKKNGDEKKFLHSRLRLFIFFLLFLPKATNAEQVCDINIKETFMKNNGMTLFEVIDLLVQQVPFKKEKVEHTLSTSFFLREQNEYTISFNANDIQLADGVLIRNIELRASKNLQTPGLLIIDIVGKCFSLKKIKNHYDALEITGVPRGKSLDESTTYSASLPWGTLSFGFKERDPQCLSWVVLDPLKMKKK